MKTGDSYIRKFVISKEKATEVLKAMGICGAPDVICVVGGQFIGIEVKDIKGRLNENQMKFKEDLERAGGIYIVARSIDDILNNSLFS